MAPITANNNLKTKHQIFTVLTTIRIKRQNPHVTDKLDGCCGGNILRLRNQIYLQCTSCHRSSTQCHDVTFQNQDMTQKYTLNNWSRMLKDSFPRISSKTSHNLTLSSSIATSASNMTT